MLEAHDEQAKRNHGGQDLERLRERHGISPCEALAIMEDRLWTKLDLEWSFEELARRIKDWESEREKKKLAYWDFIHAPRIHEEAGEWLQQEWKWKELEDEWERALTGHATGTEVPNT